MTCLQNLLFVFVSYISVLFFSHLFLGTFWAIVYSYILFGILFYIYFHLLFLS